MTSVGHGSFVNSNVQACFAVSLKTYPSVAVAVTVALVCALFQVTS